MGDITLINMSIAKNFGDKVVYERSSAGIFSLIAALEASGYEVNFHEHFLDYRLSFAEEINHFLSLVDDSSAFVGIGCHSIHLPFVISAAKKIKESFPEKRVILGGIGPSSVAGQLLENFGFIDGVVMGEGEQTLCELIGRRNGNFNGIKGVSFRQDSNVVVAHPREPIGNLDSLPLPAYNRMDFRQYEIPTVITARGCNFGCAFCSINSFWGGSVRFRSIDNVMEELRILADNYGVKYVFFGDPTFVIDRNRAIELCRRLSQESLDLKWECLVRADLMDEELMEQMGRSGCEAVFYGMESGSDNVLAKVKRGLTVEKALETIRKSTQYFKTVEVSLMWGFPFETLEDFYKTLRLRDNLLENMHCQVQFRWLEPYSTTPLYEEYKDELFLPEEISYIYRPEVVEQEVSKGQDFYKAGEASAQGIKICTNVTSIRTVIAASHIVNMAKRIIKNYPQLFCDYYRYKTPHLKEKVSSAQRHSLY